ncbi:MAG TPA: hypothetical protein VFX98_18305, partial [Longimicrobiaceae bacterium]|nr:hypothetical protein [Longimicrobiaceae bacterium]
VIAALQGVPGVVAVDLDLLERVGGGEEDEVPAAVVLPAASTRWTGTAIEPSELLLLDANGITLYEVAA